MRRFAFALLPCLLAGAPMARADITVGAILSLTGPAASLGIPERQAIDLMPRSVAGEAIRYVVLDDATDTTAAVRDAQKLIEQEHVDVIIGPSVTPSSLALLDPAGRAGVPFLTLAGSGTIIEPQEGSRRWAFKVAPDEPLMSSIIVGHMKKTNGHSLAIVAQATSFGDAFANAMTAVAGKEGIRTVASERYNPTDNSVTAQVLKVMASHPDAVFIAATGTPGALPVIELRNRGYKGAIYLTQAIANRDFLRVAGKAAEGAMFPVSPLLVAEQLSDANPVKRAAVEYVRMTEGKYGPGSRSLFGASAWDSFLMIEAAIPRALQAGRPGTPEFRKGLRDALEQTTNFVCAEGVYNLSAGNHGGSDRRAQVLVEIRDGTWKLLQE